MTGNTNSHRAVFLSVLLVLSVFAGTVAFTGSVAAIGDPQADGGTITNKTVPETSNNTHSITLNASLNTSRSAYVNYNVSFDTAFDLSGTTNTTVTPSTNNVDIVGTSFDTSQNNFTVNVSTDGTGGSADDDQVNLTFDLVGVKAPEVSSNTDYNVIFALDNKTDGSVQDSRTLGTITVESTPSGAPELESAIHYDDAGDEGKGVELAFSEPVSIPQKSDVSLYDDGSSVTINKITPAPSDSPDAARYFLDTGSTIATGDVEIKLSSDVEDADGKSISDTDNQSVTVAPVTVNVNDKKNVYEGSTVAIVDKNSNTNVDVEVEGPDNFYFSGSTGTNSEVFVFNTTNEALGQYNVSIDGSTIENTQINLRNLGLTASLDDQSVTTEDSIEGTVTARASNRPLTVELLDSNGDVVDDSGATVSADLNGQGEYDFSFDASDTGLDLEAGNYSVRVTDDYSGIEVETETVTVSSAGDDETSFDSSVVTDQRGDVLEIGVSMESTDYATLSFGTQSQGVVSNVTVHDDDGDNQATLYLNTYNLNNTAQTYAAGASANPWSLGSDSDDEITFANISTRTTDLIDAGEYDLEVRPGESESADSTDVATVVLEERNTTAFRSWTARDGYSVSDLEDINEGLADGEITQTDEIANGDLVVHQLVASGLEGALDAQANEDVTSEFFALKNTSANGGVYNLTIEEADPGANQAPKMVNITEANTTVIADGENDTYFVIVDTGVEQYYDGTSIADDTELEANFTVFNTDATDFTSADLDDDEDETRLLSYDVVEPEISVSEPYDVSNAADQTVGGTTSLAPGTELTLRVRSTGDTQPSFLKTASPVVQSDRTWSATFDFSGQNVGDEYDIVVDDGSGGADEVTESGEVVEVVETPTTTATPEPDTATPNPTTATPNPTTATGTSAPDTQTSAPATETPTSTPGFGVVVSLTALVAAALLAIRRD